MRSGWDYGKFQTNLINRAIDQLNWGNLFSDKNYLTSNFIQSNHIKYNFIPNKTILRDDRDLLG